MNIVSLKGKHGTRIRTLMQKLGLELRFNAAYIDRSGKNVYLVDYEETIKRFRQKRRELDLGIKNIEFSSKFSDLVPSGNYSIGQLPRGYLLTRLDAA